MRTIFFLMGVICSYYLYAGQPVELGEVNWVRSMVEAKTRSLEQEKPIFILFQEVPGCSTCQNFGKNVLSHPTIVELIETYFIPLAIFNNKGGADHSTLNYYSEPSWNNPVLRIVGADKKDILPRHAGAYTAVSVMLYIFKALNKSEVPLPDYAVLVMEELEAAQHGTETIVPSMYCFWTGEKVYGDIDGVVRTQAGFKNGKEIVLVEYDPQKMDKSELLEYGKKSSCADGTFSDSKGVRLDYTQQYFLSNSELGKLPLSPIQRTKINAKIGSGKTYQSLISPIQKEILEYLQENTFDLSGDWKQDYFKLKALMQTKS